MKQTKFREFTFCNADQCEIMIDINTKTGAIVDMYCYADNVPFFENTETGKELKTAVAPDRINKSFVTITNKSIILKRMLSQGDYLPLLDNEDPDYNTDVDILTKCLNKYKINYSETIFQ